MILLSLVACTTTENTVLSSSKQYTEPSEYSFDSLPREEQEIELHELEGELNRILATLRSYHSAPILESYSTVMNYADASCPTDYSVNGNAFWYGSCTSDLEMEFDGYLFYNRYEDHDFFNDGGLWDVIYLSGATSMNYPSSERVHWGGSAYQAQGVNIDGHPVYFSSIQGSFWDQTKSGWLKEGIRADFWQYAIQFNFPQGTANGYSINGNLFIDDSSVLNAVEFHHLISYPELIHFPCEEEPLGSISLRSIHGEWFELSFDISSEEWELTGSCDGCGALRKEDNILGEICIDTSVLLNWEEPWSSY